tara:strand:- start:193 stop:879 length:687 start_codon:yes stop_codon:yes gene_type:complete
MSFTNFGDLAVSKNQSIIFVHVATEKTVFFPAFLTEYSDNYSVSWGNEQIFGRNDPIKPYQSTTRQLQVGFDVLSPDLEAAKTNLAKMSILTKMLYPVYTAPMNGAENSLGRTIKAPPIMRIKFVNMIQSADGNGSLLGCIEGFNYAPNAEPGYFIERDGSIFPKHFNISFRFTPQHESPLGWGAEDKEFITDNFPYSAELTPSAENSQGTNPALERAKQERILGYRG